MAELASQSQDNDPLSPCAVLEKQQSFNTLLAQLKSRNSHNTLIIKKFIRKISKRHTFLAQLTPHSLSPQTSYYPPPQPHLQPNSHEIELQYAQFHSEQQCLAEPTLKDSALFKTADTHHGEAETVLPVEEKCLPLGKQRGQKYNFVPPGVKHDAQLDANFASYLRNVYVKELLEKARDKKIKGKAQIKKAPQTSVQEPTISKFINVKSLVFGSQDLSCAGNFQELPLNLKMNRVSTEGNGGSQTCIQQIHKNSRGAAGYKLCNNFLPSISRHFGKIKKRDLANLQSRVRGEQARNEDYGYDMNEIDSMERIGISFRINTLQIKKHY